jgi:hypothetical protein
MMKPVLGTVSALALATVLSISAHAQTSDPGIEFGFMPRTMTVTLLNDGGKYVAIDLKHIAKGESCRMDEGATIARVGQGEPGMVRVRYAAGQISSGGCPFMTPYATASNLQIEGADEILSAEAGQAIAIVLHELATNAAKYGAFSAAGGHVSVRWSHKRNGNVKSWLSIRWEESGGPSVVPPTRSGFGTSIICDLIPYELGGTVELVHAPEGVRCTIEILDPKLGNSN